MATIDGTASGRPVTRDEIRRVCGDLPDWKIVEIMATGGDVAALEEGATLAEGADDGMPPRMRPPYDPATRICEILVADEEPDEPGPAAA